MKNGSDLSTVEQPNATQQCQIQEQSQKLKLQQKKEVFERFLLELVAKRRDKEVGKLSKEEVNEVLAHYSMTSLNKLLYFACIADVEHDSDNNTYTQGSLLELFDNFQAWYNGPLEDDVYSNRRYLDHFSYDWRTDASGDSAERFMLQGDIHNVAQLGNNYKDALSKVFKILNRSGFLDLSEGEIIWVSHNRLIAWRECFREGRGTSISKFLKSSENLYWEKATFDVALPAT